MKNPVRSWVFSDDHCGHAVGFTPPWRDFEKPPQEPEYKAKAWAMRRAIFDWQDQILESLPPPDVVLINGDCVDGKGERSGGTEQHEIDENEQVNMAAEVIKWRANRGSKKARVFMSYGTPYHTGRLQDNETPVAGLVGAEKIGGVDNIDIRGVIINYRHAVSRSIIPHGRFTSLAREKLWNDLWAVRGEYPSADIVIRSHVHYHVFCGTPDWLAFTTPACQGYGSKFGVRQVTGTIDVGFMTLDIYGPGEIDWHAHVWRSPFQEAHKVLEGEEVNFGEGETPETDA